MTSIMAVKLSVVRFIFNGVIVALFVMVVVWQWPTGQECVDCRILVVLKCKQSDPEHTVQNLNRKLTLFYQLDKIKLRFV